jgi:transglutaminase-like putative cysteine protease
LSQIEINHTTSYVYHQPVQITPSRLMLRPRESRDVRVLAYDLSVSPDASVSWSQGVAGNAVAVASFGAPAAQLRIASRARVELCARPYPVFDIAASAISFPFRYADDEWVDLGPLSAPPNDPDGGLRTWAQGFVAAFPTDTLSLLKDMNAGTRSAVGYEAREDQGTQTPAETLSRRRGSCRDIATLFIEAARSLGFGARAVSGYLHDPMRTLLGSADTGSTHAWAEVFVPGAGWITFDPSNDRVGAADLIPVAVARDIRLALPVVGGYVGAPDAFESMAVEVSVLAV